MHRNFKLIVEYRQQPSCLGSYYNFDAAYDSINRNAYIVLEYLVTPTEYVRQRLHKPPDKHLRAILGLLFITNFFLLCILIGIAKMHYSKFIKVGCCLNKKPMSFVSQVRKASSFVMSTGFSKYVKTNRRRGRVAKRKKPSEVVDQGDCFN